MATVGRPSTKSDLPIKGDADITINPCFAGEDRPFLLQRVGFSITM